MTKKEWAAWCHDYLLNTLHEPDETDWSAARALVDIYDCHSCVYHIAQVYVKGIIPARTLEGQGSPLERNLKFGTDEEVPNEEAELYLLRLKDKSKRLKIPPIKVPVIKKIDYSQIKTLQNHKIINVANEETYISIIQNPRGVSQNLLQPIILTCQNGYKSTLAADLLIKAGYANIFTLN